MKLFLYAAAGRKQTEHDMAYRLLALAVEKELGLRPLPEIAREAGGKPFFPARPEPPSAPSTTGRWALTWKKSGRRRSICRQD